MTCIENVWYDNLIISRFYRSLYHLTAFLFYFIFCAPMVSWIVGIYLFVTVNFIGIHWTEAFSSLRLDSYKNFLRFHIRPNGSLKCYVVGIENVPKRWKKDKKWTGNGKLLTNYNEKFEILNQIQNNNNNNHNNNENIFSKIDFNNIRDKRGIGPSYKWKYPSKWIPYYPKKYHSNENKSKFQNTRNRFKGNKLDDPDCRCVKIVDSFVLN